MIKTLVETQALCEKVWGEQSKLHALPALPDDFVGNYITQELLERNNTPSTYVNYVLAMLRKYKAECLA